MLQTTPDAVTLSTDTTWTPSLSIPQHSEPLPNTTSSPDELLPITYHSQELLPPIGHYAMGTVLAIITLGGMVQNTATLLALNKRQNPQRIEFLIKVLLFSDLLMCVLALPFAVTSSFARRWLFGSIGCNWYGFSMFFVGVFSINLLTAICVERYCTVRQMMQIPVSAKTQLLVISLVVSALGALVWSILPLIGVSSYQPEGVGTSCSVDWKSKRPGDQAYFIVMLICCFVAPLGIIITCYSHIYIQVTSRKWSVQMMQQDQLSQRRIKMEIHLAKTIFLAAGSFVLAWSPYTIVSLVAIITDPEAIPPIVFSLPAIFAKSSVFGNSFVYVFMNHDLRHSCLQSLGLRKTGFIDEEVLALPNQQREVADHFLVSYRLEPREACFEMNDLWLNGGDRGASNGVHQFI